MLLSHFLEITKMILIILLFNDLKNISALLFWHISKACFKNKTCMGMSKLMPKDRKR